jgi:sulfate permease, SulP family
MNNDKEKQWPLFRSFQGLGLGGWRLDLIAGLTLAAIAIPEQMATARLGGFPSHIGFFAFIAGSIAFAAFGSNRFLSSGADSTITPIFAGALATLATVGGADYGELAAVLALLVGLFLLLAGVFRAGWVADLLSIPVMTGFLAGVAIHIAISQTPALLGLPPGEGEVFRRVAMIAGDIGETNFTTLAIGASCLASIVLFEKISPRIPGALIALAAATFVVAHFHLEERGVEVVGAFTVAPPRAPAHIPSLDHLSHVLGLAVIISIIIMVQTAATSRSFPGAPGETPDVDRDFVGLGVGGLLSGLSGAFPVNASPPRTAVVAETGGRSQIAGLVACAVVVATALYGGELLGQAPEAALAGMLLFVAGRIFRAREMLDIGRKTKAEFGLVVVTMLAVVILPVQTGVGLAIMLSLAHGVWTITRTRLLEFERLPGTSVWWPASPAVAGEKLAGVLVVGFQAPLSFLNAYQFQHDMRRTIARADGGLRLVVLEASSIVEIDFTAARILGGVIAQCRAQGVDFAIVRLESLRAQAALENFRVMATLGADRLFHSVDEATRKLTPEAAVTAAARRQIS